MPKKLLIVLIGLMMFIASDGLSQNTTVQTAPPNLPVPRRLVDFPTAATLRRASFDVQLDAFSNDGVLCSIDIGLHRRFMIGISYGGVAILGDSKPHWHKRPEYLVKLMLIDESMGFPALTIGFESQGTGFYDDSLNRYRFKAPGFYLVGSKGYKTNNWYSGLHAGMNYNPLEDDNDKENDISFFTGFDMTFNNNLSLLGEYQAALNDNKKDSQYGRGRGYLNLGFKWTFSDRLELGINFKNLLNNSRYTRSITRELRITYVERF